MKWKKWFLIGWGMIIAASVIVALQIRASLPAIDLSTAGLNKLVLHCGAQDIPDGSPYLRKDATIKDLMSMSDLVVKVTATGERAMKYDSILTTVNVDTVYKGDSSLAGQKIYVCEYATIFRYNNENTYSPFDPYNIMNEGGQYYLLLNFHSMPDGYRYSEKDKRTYLICNAYYGKFSVQSSEDIRIVSPEDFDTLTYSDIREWDLIPTSTEELQNYHAKRQDLLQLLQ